MIKLLAFLSDLPSRIYGRIQWKIAPVLLAWKVQLFFMWRRTSKPHGLQSPLIISLTSYPPRFNKLPLTLKCLLSQSMAADRIILWIAHQDKQALTPAILNLQKAGLEISYCDDLYSYKKIIPTLKNYPNSFIATADDDLYYWPTWLEEFVDSYKMDAKDVICHRMHRIRLGADNLPLPYSEWEGETQRIDASPLNFQTGIGGVFYPPGVFHSDVLNVDAFKKLCPRADDVWLYWMMRLNGGISRKVGVVHPLYCWPTTQRTALWCSNVDQCGNDIQIRKMVDHYGFTFPTVCNN